VAFKVDLDIFAGPLDLLLYLVKKHEVDVTEVPIATIAEAFLAYLEVLEELAIEQVGEFVELASVLLEIKARALVPRPEEQEEQLEPIREDLVERLLEYKQFRDAAVLLEDRAREWESRFVRAHTEELPKQGPPAEIHFADVQVWDLVGALGRVLQRQERRKPGRSSMTTLQLRFTSSGLSSCWQSKERSHLPAFSMRRCHGCESSVSFWEC